MLTIKEAGQQAYTAEVGEWTLQNRSELQPTNLPT